MRCLNCGGSITNETMKCNFCGMTVVDAKKNHDEKLSQVLLNNKQIDLYLNINQNYEEFSQTKLESFFNELIDKFELLITKNNLSEDKLIEISKKIEDIEIKVQSNNNIRTEIIEQNLEDLSNYDFIRKLIVEYKPARVYTAASELRNHSEAALKNFHEQEYIYTDGRWGFKNTYKEMFKDITKSNKISDQMVRHRRHLNWFVHQSEDNDKKINQNYPELLDKINFINEVLEIYNTYQLL